MGLYRNEAERFGMLDAQAWRAARLVVDTGMHALRWTRQQSIDQLLAAGLSETDATIETDRYISWPGQALTYKIGQREIERLRARALGAGRRRVRPEGLPRRGPRPWLAAARDARPRAAGLGGRARLTQPRRAGPPPTPTGRAHDAIESAQPVRDSTCARLRRTNVALTGPRHRGTIRAENARRTRGSHAEMLAEHPPRASGSASMTLPPGGPDLPGGADSNFRAWGEDTIYVDRGKGGRVWDLDGNEFVDLRMGYGPVILGHGDPRVDDYVNERMRRGVSFSLTSEDEVGAMELLCEMTGWVDMARMTVSGTEATMHAMRVARAYTGRNKIVKFEGQYHGVHDYALIWVPPNDMADLGDGTTRSGWPGAGASRRPSPRRSSRPATTTSASSAGCSSGRATRSPRSSSSRCSATPRGSCPGRASTRRSER